MSHTEASNLEHTTMAKVSWRLLPLIVVIYFVAYIDRTNVGFAALGMNRELGFTAYIYGWGAGIFFLGYFLFEVPSNIALTKFGARKWIARIMISWEIVAAARTRSGGSWRACSVKSSHRRRLRTERPRAPPLPMTPEPFRPLCIRHARSSSSSPSTATR